MTLSSLVEINYTVPAPCNVANYDTRINAFGSMHGGGANFLFADGSARFLTYAADSILPALVTRDGGELIDDVD